MDEASCSSQSVRCAASWSGGVGAPARPSSSAGLCRSWPPGGAPCPLPRPPPEVAVSPFVAPTRPVARRLRRAPEAAPAAAEWLRAGRRPTLAMGPPRRRKEGARRSETAARVTPPPPRTCRTARRGGAARTVDSRASTADVRAQTRAPARATATLTGLHKESAQGRTGERRAAWLRGPPCRPWT